MDLMSVVPCEPVLCKLLLRLKQYLYQLKFAHCNSGNVVGKFCERYSVVNFINFCAVQVCVSANNFCKEARVRLYAALDGGFRILARWNVAAYDCAN